MKTKRLVAGLLSVSFVFLSSVLFVCAEVIEEYSDKTFVINEDLTEDYYELSTYEGGVIHLDLQLDPEIYDFKTFGYYSANKKTVITYDKNLICLEPGEDTVSVSVYKNSSAEEKIVNFKITALPNNLVSDDIRRKIEKLNESEHSDFQRKKSELLGALDADTPRISIDKITEFTETSDNYFEITDKINNLTKVPDVKYNGELTFYTYWFDDNGTEAIDVGYDFPMIYYYRRNDNGKRTMFQNLYPEKLELIEVCDTDYDYILYKNIFYTGDVNGDGIINAEDLVLLNTFFLGIAEESVIQNSADINFDNVIDILDICLLKNKILNM